MTEAYDLRSNIKGKPGSQGTLFQVKDKGLLNPAQRWPRGYTPERQAEVRAATAPVAVRGPQGQDEAQRARVNDAVSRSTIPTSHLAGLAKIDADVKSGTVGTYWPNHKRLAIDMVTPHPTRSREDMDQTMIHELGHHRDATSADGPDAASLTGRVEEVAQQRVDKRRELLPALPAEVTATGRAYAERDVKAGAAEGFADNYLTEHARTRGRNPQPVTKGRYEHHFTEEQIGSQYPGYRDARPAQPEHMGPQFKQETLF